MAIKVTKLLSSGFVAVYARPLAIAPLIFGGGDSTVVLEYFKDESARFSGMSSVAQENYALKLDASEVEAIQKIIYKAIDRAGIFPDGEPIDPDERMVYEH